METKTGPQSQVLQGILSSNQVKLVSLESIRSFRAWDFSWPTLTKNRRFTARNSYKSDKSFFAALEGHNKGATYSLLQSIGALDDNTHSIVLYGGALVDVVLKREQSIRDWDLRLIGPEFVGNNDKCVQAAKHFVESVLAWIREQNEQIQVRNVQHKNAQRPMEELFDMNNVKVSRCKSTITIKIPSTHQIDSTTLQSTFAPFSSVSEMFRHCRPHCSAICIYQGKVVLHQAAQYCLESLCVVMNTKSLMHCQCDGRDEGRSAAQSSSLACEVRRTIKYFDEKGFDIILPDLDMAKVPTRNLKFYVTEVLDLPSLTVIFHQIENNKIMANQLRVPEEKSVSSASGGTFGGYDEGTADINTGTSIHHNIRCLVAGVYDQFHFVTEGELVSPIFDYCPTLTPRMVDKGYETIKTSLTSGIIELDKVIQYFSATPPSKVLEMLLVEPIQALEAEAAPGRLPASFELNEDVLDEIIEAEKEAILKKLEGIREKMVEEHLDKLVEDFSEAVSTEDEIARALYGDYRVEPQT